MTQKKASAREQLDRVADSFVNDVLEMTDDEVLDDIRDLGDAPETIAKEMLKLFEDSTLQIAKAKLLAAKERVESDQKITSKVVSFDRDSARAEYNAMLLNDSETERKLTLAARNGQGQSDNDIESALDDLAELGAFEQEKSDE